MVSRTDRAPAGCTDCPLVVRELSLPGTSRNLFSPTRNSYREIQLPGQFIIRIIPVQSAVSKA